MLGRFISPARLFAGFAILALAVFAIATAPVLAAGVEVQPQGSAVTEMHAARDGSCADKDAKDSQSHGDHGTKCLAACLSVHGAVLPALPASAHGCRGPDAIAQLVPVHELATWPSALEPPPPRHA